MNLLRLETRQPEPRTILVEQIPVKERDKNNFQTMPKISICAMDIMGLSWIFQDEESWE
jgi:hypothetical protein